MPQCNCVSAAFDDVGGTEASVHRRVIGCWGGLQVVQATRDLVDAYRELHPTGRDFTFAAPQCAARLDRWLIPQRLLDRLRTE